MIHVAAFESLDPWLDQGVLGPAELHGSAVICRGQPDDLLVRLGAACALWAPLHGHACVDLDQLPSVVHALVAARRVDLGPDQFPSVAVDLPWPTGDQWRDALVASPLCRVVDAADELPVLDDHPLVLAGRLLYTQRQWIDECVVAASLRRRAFVSGDGESLSAGTNQLLDTLFADPSQRDAALVAASSLLSVIVGGPGTGKTRTIALTLAILIAEAHQRGQRLHIGLAAPTGKAAGRLGEAIAAASSAMSDAMPAAVGAELQRLSASTVHRLLGMRGTTRFRHDTQHPLAHDVIVIDEASMIALPLMARLLEAIRPDARLVLVGDPDQLASIEVGTVLADVVDAAARPQSVLHDHVVRLTTSHRQRAESPVGPLAEAIRLNRADEVIAMLRAGAVDHSTARPLLSFHDHADPLSTPDAAGVRDVVVPPLSAAHEAARAANAVEALARFGSVRVLCAHRVGPHGVADWNRRIESWLVPHASQARPQRFYPGRPLLATRNDLRLRVANGDTGIVVTDPVGVRAVFASGGELRSLSPAQLVEVETAYAMTIHKSQGSEYATVVLILPPATSPLLSRQLLYTAVTRTTDRLVVVGTEAAVVAAVNNPTHRITGLARAL